MFADEAVLPEFPEEDVTPTVNARARQRLSKYVGERMEEIYPLAHGRILHSVWKRVVGLVSLYIEKP